MPRKIDRSMRGSSVSVAPRLGISRITHRGIFNSLLTSITSSPIGYDKYENSKLAKRASLKENCGIQDHADSVDDAIRTR